MIQEQGGWFLTRTLKGTPKSLTKHQRILTGILLGIAIVLMLVIAK